MRRKRGEQWMMREMDIWDYLANRSERDVLVDLREKRLVDFGTIPGALHIPLDDLGRLYQLPKDQNIYIFCQAGEISGEIAELLSDAGYNACNLTGGYREYLRRQMAEQEQKGTIHTDE